MTGWATDRRPGRAAAVVLAVALAGIGTAWAQEPDAARQQEIMDLVQNTCTNCHGPGLVGEVGPALTPAALKDKDAAMLADTILNGRPDTQMMPFTGMVTEDEAAWLVGRLKAGLTP
jgi:cytochrome c55X